MDVANWPSEVVSYVMIGLGVFLIFAIAAIFIAGRPTTPSNQTPENREDKRTAKNS